METEYACEIFHKDCAYFAYANQFKDIPPGKKMMSARDGEMMYGEC